MPADPGFRGLHPGSRGCCNPETTTGPCIILITESPTMRPLLRTAALLLLVVPWPARAADPADRHLLYVAAPGIRDYLQFGGAGVLVFDIDHNHAFVRRIPTPASRIDKPENVKGVCACA